MTTEQNTPKGIDYRIPLLVLVPVVLILLFVVWGFGSHKHEAKIEGTFPIDAAIQNVTLLYDVGNLDIVIGDAGEVGFKAKTLLATGSAEDLERAKGMPFTIERVPSDDATTLVLRVTETPDGFAVLPESPENPAAKEVPRLFRQMDAFLSVPVNVGVAVEARQANIRVDTRQAATSVRTQSGDIMALHVAGALRLRNGDGDTIIDQHRGPLDAFVRGKSRFSLSEVNGPVRIVSEEGEVHLSLPQHASVDLEARSLTGNVRNQFGLDSKSISAKGHAVTGKIGKGEHRVTVEARAGTLTVLRATSK